jgi:hypothetical protein
MLTDSASDVSPVRPEQDESHCMTGTIVAAKATTIPILALAIFMVDTRGLLRRRLEGA